MALVTAYFGKDYLENKELVKQARQNPPKKEEGESNLVQVQPLEKGSIKTVYFGANGIFEERSSWLGSSIKKVNNYETHGQGNIQETIYLKKMTFEKLPAIALQHVMNWYKKVTDESGKEAQVNFYNTTLRNPDNPITSIPINGVQKELKDIEGVKFWTDTIFSYTPKQTNSATQTDVHTTDNVYENLNKYVGMYIETHSHNSMAAFRSSTDEANSGNDALQLVFGKFKTNEVEMFSWITVRELQYPGLSVRELENYIELPKYTRVDEAAGKIYIPMEETQVEEIDEDVISQWESMVVKQTWFTGGSYWNRGGSYLGAYSTGATSNIFDTDPDYYNVTAPGGKTSQYAARKTTAATSTYSAGTRFVPYTQRVRNTALVAKNTFEEMYPDLGVDMEPVVEAYISGALLHTYTVLTDSQLIQKALTAYAEALSLELQEGEEGKAKKDA